MNRKLDQQNNTSKHRKSAKEKNLDKQPQLINTIKILKEHGISQKEIDGIIKGEVSWDITDDKLLLLFNSEGGTRTVTKLSNKEFEDLLNSARFESRLTGSESKSSIFIQGSIDDWAGVSIKNDWAGVSIKTNWRGYVDGYINAAQVLGKYGNKNNIEPYLFVCRHSIELLLKSITMLYQNFEMLAEDLPEHHDLKKLWSSTYPIILQYLNQDRKALAEIGQFIQEYHEIDPGSYSFRYPVAKKNTKFDHQEYLKAFSMRHHIAHFTKTVELLNGIIKKIEMQLLLRPLNEMMVKYRIENQKYNQAK